MSTSIEIKKGIEVLKFRDYKFVRGFFRNFETIKIYNAIPKLIKMQTKTHKITCPKSF